MWSKSITYNMGENLQCWKGPQFKQFLQFLLAVTISSNLQSQQHATSHKLHQLVTSLQTLTERHTEVEELPPSTSGMQEHVHMQHELQLLIAIYILSHTLIPLNTCANLYPICS